MVQICFALSIPSGEFALHPFCGLQFLVLYQKHNLLRMRLQIINNQRYWANGVQSYLLFEVWQKNNMIFEIWLYSFSLSIPVRNYLVNSKHELHFRGGS